MSSEREWTAQQREAIETDGGSLLVSAAAGSGKTAVLAERFAHFVCDAPEPCNVDQLLVVTFTESAAGQMREKIQQALRHRLERPKPRPDGSLPAPARIARQLALVEHAQISTVHGFCARLLRQNFNLADLDPNFQVIDGDEAALMRLEVARDLFDRKYEEDKTGEFQALIDGYGDGRDDPVVEQVIHAHELLTSLIDPSDWLDRALHRVEESAAKPLEHSALGIELLTAVETALHRLERRCEDVAKALRRLGGFPGYVARVEEWSGVILDWIDQFGRRGIDALGGAVRAFDVGRAPAIKSDTPNKDLAKSLLDSLREQLTAGPLADLLAFTEAQWRQGQKATLQSAGVLLGLVSEFRVEYEKRKKEVRGLDFADLERCALDVLAEKNGNKTRPSQVARAYHFQYRHVLVDEYQDINELQDAILSLVSRECVAHEGEFDANLFSVGDVKQSIFRFRLAEPARFLDRARRFRESNGDDAPKNHGATKTRDVGKVSDAGKMSGAGNAAGATKADAATKAGAATAAVGGRVIDLQKNFRSRGPLLDAINGVFNVLMTEEAAEIEYDASHFLHAGAKYPAGAEGTCFKGAPIELHVMPQELGDRRGSSADDSEPGSADLERSDYEAMLCARRILKITGADGSTPACVAGDDGAGGAALRPARFGDVVILLRSLRFKADVFADVLRKHGVPVHSEGGAGFFESMEIRDVVALLSLLDNQQQDVPLAAVLRSPLAALPAPEDALARIRLAYAGEGAPVPFHQAVVRYAIDHDDELAARLRDFLAQLSAWRDGARQRPLAELIWHVYDSTGYLAFCAGLDDGRQRAANLLLLHAKAREFGSFLRPGLYRFMRHFSKLRDEKDLSRPSLAGAGEAVRVMSIHRSKGQEFPIVILPDLGKRHNLSDTRGPILIDRKAGLGLSVVDEEKRIRYPSLASTLVKASLHRQTLAEELRLLYVAMTRAKEHLILIGTAAETAPQRWLSTWASHTGPLPADEILGSATVLDWLGPVYAATGGVGSSVFELFAHTVDEVRAWPNPRGAHRGLTPRQLRLAALQPLEPPPPVTPDAAATIARFEAVYPFERYTAVESARAAASASAAPETEAAPSGRGGTNAAAETWALPRFLSAGRVATPAEIGAATHLVLQHLDFSRPCDDADVSAQINDLVRKQVLSAAAASAIDGQAITWLVGTDLGGMLKANASRLRREASFALAAQLEAIPGTPPGAPMDAVMVRGRVDVMFPAGGGFAVVDYKTDRIAPGEVEDRAETYGSQWKTYRRAIERIAGKPVAAVYLVFLSPRMVIAR